MTDHGTHPKLPAKIQIDTGLLLRSVPGLLRVKRKQRTWNEFGELLLREFLHYSPMESSVRDAADMQTSPEAMRWIMAKRLIHAVLATQDPKYQAIRKRLGNLQQPSTALLSSLLGLWLAGEIRIPVSVTGPMVAAMLYAAAEAGGDWQVLGDSAQI